MKLTHLDEGARPTMVDIAGKQVTRRTAVAESCVRFPPAVAQYLRAHAMRSAKGAVFDTAVIAGVMAAKRTHELIPFCHPLNIESCKIDIEMRADEAFIRCEAALHHKTGVEMEALVGASIAALTIYDMCKALSHEIVIGDTRLVHKDGGRSSFTAEAKPPAGGGST